jgi:hypothetical protein
LNAPYLSEWARRAAGRQAQGADVLVFCQCPDDTLDPSLSSDLHRRVGAFTPVAPLPWDDLASAEPPGQARLL